MRRHAQILRDTIRGTARGRRGLLQAGYAGLLLAVATLPANAGPADHGGGSVKGARVVPSARQETGTTGGNLPFSISVDGLSVTGARPDPADSGLDEQRQTDIGLGAVDIQVKYDGLEVRPTLNLMTDPVRHTYRPGDPVEFLATSNYPAFIVRSEIRVYEMADHPSPDPVAIIPVPINGRATWRMPADREASSRFVYLLRVYDSRNRYDETAPRALARTGHEPSPAPDAVAPGMGEDNTAFRNIPVQGGAVTVYGRNVPAGYQVRALHDTIPVDNERAFVAQRILPPGQQDVDVAVLGTGRKSALEFTRRINIPQNDWFYVALADLTVGRRSGDAGIETVRPGEYDKIYTNGRLAFYLKGKVRGEYLLTAAGDTGEGPIGNMFRGMDAKDPRQLLRRIDPDQFYPVYGDDSTAVDDAPTNGKFYVRLERGDSHVMWGNYKTVIRGTEFMHSERALYGANAVYRSEDTTSFGERKTDISLYAAQPDTLPQRDEFLGTGGSAYFMRRQDITVGSETIQVEIRDATTGAVLERRALRYGEDYTFDYLQGVLILKRPVSASSIETGAVREGALGGNKAFVIAQYEYTPAIGSVDGYVYGGRAQQWLNENIHVGVTGMNETTGVADQQALGADFQLRKSDRTYLSGEIAYSTGPGFGTSQSYDGGITIGDLPSSGEYDRNALAWRLNGQADLAELTSNGVTGTAGFYYQEKQAGFSTLAEQVFADQRIWGTKLDIDLTGTIGLNLVYDDFSEGASESSLAGPLVGGRTKRKGTAELTDELADGWTLGLGVSYLDTRNPMAVASGKSGYDGARLDAGLRLTYEPDDDHKYYVFGQATLDVSGDIHRADRGGVGTVYRLDDQWSLEGEVSYGTLGIGALAGVAYEPDKDTTYTFGYRLDPDRAYDVDRSDTLVGTDSGTFVLSAQKRYDPYWTAYAENNWDLFGKRTSLTKTYGVVYTPDDLWTFDTGFEAGEIRDDTIDPSTGLQRSDFERNAVSFGVGYKEADIFAANVKAEARFERSDDDTRDLDTYLVKGGLSYKSDPDWRVLLGFDSVFSDGGAESAFRNGSYLEGSVGFAYRPVDNDRLNALFKYVFLYDEPGANQVSAVTGDEFGPAQKSHILSADFTYDLTPWLSVGAKYGFRHGEVRQRLEADRQRYGDWQTSSAHLGIVRADLHVVHGWDALLEGRALYMPQAKTTEYGALAAVYRHVGDNFKIGVGYNFGSFSDDLRDLTLNDRGVFMNVVGKF